MTMKKMLCINIIKNGSCPYGYRCLYAHNLNEQSIDPLKKKAYDVIKSFDDHDQHNKNIIDLSEDDDLAKTFLIYTKVCTECKNKKCTGGYNCKFGAISNEYQLCYNDLMYGSCNNFDCKKKHITKRGILPIMKQKKLQDIKKNIENNLLINLNKTITYDSESSDESPTSIEKVKRYLNEYDSDEECEKSIFLIDTADVKL